jgi:hypothetical protein
VTFHVTATDNGDLPPLVICSPPSGSVFPVGTTTVTCTAIDTAGNQNSSEFTLTVLPKARRAHL